MSGNENLILDFLVSLYETGVGYSTINTAVSALSTFLSTNNGISIGRLPIIKRFLKGVFELRPTKPRYVFVWDANIVLDYLQFLYPVFDLSLMELTHKLVMLVALVSAQRVQTLSLMNMTNMIEGYNSFTFLIDSPVKQSRPGYTQPVIKLECYAANESLCVAHTMSEYLRRTKDLRGSANDIFISYIKPHKSVSTETISRWVKTVLCEAGIDVNYFTAHSTRAASTSSAIRAGVVVDEILQAAGWSGMNTFAKFYNKPVVAMGEFGSKLLASSTTTPFFK